MSRTSALVTGLCGIIGTDRLCRTQHGKVLVMEDVQVYRSTAGSVDRGWLRAREVGEKLVGTREADSRRWLLPGRPPRYFVVGRQDRVAGSGMMGRLSQVERDS